RARNQITTKKQKKTRHKRPHPHGPWHPPPPPQHHQPKKTKKKQKNNPEKKKQLKNKPPKNLKNKHNPITTYKHPLYKKKKIGNT
ncbi:hypothetical protein ACPWRG_22830, partial [Pandoraea pneumonica]